MNVFEKLYRDLKIKHGKPSGQWSLWCKRPKTVKEKEEVMIEAILTQRTNWKNVELTMDNLKKANIDSLKKIYRINLKSRGKFAYLIKPSGFYPAKTEYLFNLAKYILKNHKNIDEMKKENLEELRRELLEQKGIGPETADSILLYALEKPIFVIDEYTRRLVKKNQITENLRYDSLQELFEKNLRRNWRLYQDFHALIVIDGKSRR